jgi:DNA-binding Lrp family transcriptional regulator
MEDDLDLKILQLLQKDAKQTYEQIGEKLNRSQSTIRDRIKKMEEDRTILGYSAIVDQERIGIGVDAFLTADIDPTQSNNAMVALFSMDNVSEILHLTGERKFLLRIKASNNKEFTDLLDKKIRPLGFTHMEITMVLNPIIRYPGLKS